MKRILLIIVLLLISSCNYYRLRYNNLTDKFKHAGLQQYLHEKENYSISYWYGGKGTPIVLLNGFGATATFQWYDVVGELKGKYTMLVPDLIYFGKSTSKENNFSVEYQCDKILELIDHYGIKKFHIAGISYGGLVALTIAHKVPNRVGKIIVCDGPIKYYTSQDKKNAVVYFEAKDIYDLLIPEEPKYIPRLMRIAYYKAPSVPRFVLQNIYDNMFTNQVEEKRGLLKHMEEEEKFYHSHPYHINSPILLIWGEFDRLVPPRVGHQLKKYFGNKATLKIIEKTAHMPNLEKPHDFNKIFLNFLDKG